MKIARFLHNGRQHHGVVEDGTVHILGGDIFDHPTPTAVSVPVREVKFLIPTAPTKVMALGMNYRSHAEELNLDIPDEPVFFYKPASSLIATGEAILYPRQSQRVDYEAELAVVIGRKAKDVSPDKAFDYVLGYTCFNDVTARDIQFRKSIEFVKSKSFDTFAAVGPWIETEVDPTDLQIRCTVNGEVRQSSRTSDLIFKVNEAVAFLSTIMTLYPGDIIATGTPSGIGPLAVGDEVTVEIEGIGSLSNTVTAHAIAERMAS